MDWARDQYNKQYDAWVPWLEDLYLRYFTRDNKASYTTRNDLGKTKVTNVSRVDALQDSANDVVADQIGQDGLCRPVGDHVSHEGINRVEREGKDDKGRYVPAPEGVSDPLEAVSGAGNAAVCGLVD
ncbi:uncharacterized protein P884DRAFT_244907 [Thermothelomyces heterothallicus CBS 202.75]|uniref:uncharacterized protein n=1 Tax=Thermothelomyces heterothallicus CBS 202.75 TaxID=1149848 RepID=UPI0037432159